MIIGNKKEVLKVSKTMTVSLNQWGTSLGIRIPKKLVDSLKLHSKDKLELTTEEDKIVLRKKKDDIDKLFENFDLEGFYKEHDLDRESFDKPVGREIF